MMTVLLLQVTIFILSAAIAWRIGGEPERRGAQILLLLCIGALARRVLTGAAPHHMDLFGLALDLTALAGFAAIAAFAWRVWPICAASLQLLAVMFHIAQLFQIDFDLRVYLILRGVPTFLLWIVLLFGTLNYVRLKRAGVNMPSWRNWSG